MPRQLRSICAPQRTQSECGSVFAHSKEWRISLYEQVASGMAGAPWRPGVFEPERGYRLSTGVVRPQSSSGPTKVRSKTLRPRCA